jgi:hypothetical protein
MPKPRNRTTATIKESAEPLRIYIGDFNVTNGPAKGL